MNSSEDFEEGESLSLHVLMPDELAMLMAIQRDPREEVGRSKKREREFELYVRTEDGIKRVSRVFVELDEDDEEL